MQTLLGPAKSVLIIEVSSFQGHDPGLELYKVHTEVFAFQGAHIRGCTVVSALLNSIAISGREDWNWVITILNNFVKVLSHTLK